MKDNEVSDGWGCLLLSAAVSLFILATAVADYLYRISR